eukprot:3704916-Rhodomonas_salina.2
MPAQYRTTRSTIPYLSTAHRTARDLHTLAQYAKHRASRSTIPCVSTGHRVGRQRAGTSTSVAPTASATTVLAAPPGINHVSTGHFIASATPPPAPAPPSCFGCVASYARSVPHSASQPPRTIRYYGQYHTAALGVPHTPARNQLHSRYTAHCHGAGSLIRI